MEFPKWREENLVILEELIHKRFVSLGNLVKQLGSFEGSPAVFCLSPPGDSQGGWEENSPCPKLVYSFQRKADGERHSAGTLSVSLLCQGTHKAPEETELLVKDCLRDVILKPEGGNPCCFIWKRTEAFAAGEEKSSITDRREIRFDILEYPSQESTDPDPIIAAAGYLKGLYPECLVMGCDNLGDITEVTEQQPVVYCRLAALEKSEETNTVAWVDSKIAIHILSPSHEVRMKLAAGMANRMSLDGELILPDRSPMFLKGISVNYRSDYLKEGQILFTGHYGLLRYRPEQRRLLQGKISYA